MEGVAVFYGGKSSEHDISILTALGVMNALDKTKYNICPIYIDKDNKWMILKEYMNIRSYINVVDGIDLATGFYNGYILKKGITGFRKYKKIDIAINCCHGLNGEDGTLSGLIKIANIPMVGSGVLASSIGMDKSIMKDIFVKNDIPCPSYLYFKEKEYLSNQEAMIEKIEQKINYPIIVKPANLGSSIGINISKDRNDLKKNIKIALNFDKKIVIEQVIENLREINCSVIGNYQNVEASILEEPKNWKSFLNFDEKYILLGENKKQLDVHISNDMDETIKNLAIKCFKILGCQGVVRVDFLLNDLTKEIYVNEINIIPGSYANYLWKNKYSYSKLLDKLVEFAKEDFEYMSGCSYSYKSNVLRNYCGSKNGVKIK